MVDARNATSCKGGAGLLLGAEVRLGGLSALLALQGCPVLMAWGVALL